MLIQSVNSITLVWIIIPSILCQFCDGSFVLASVESFHNGLKIDKHLVLISCQYRNTSALISNGSHIKTEWSTVQWGIGWVISNLGSCIAQGWFEVTSRITPKLFNTKSNAQIIVSITKCEKQGNETFNVRAGVLVRIKWNYLNDITQLIIFVFVHVFNVDISTCSLSKFSSFEMLASAKFCSWVLLADRWKCWKSLILACPITIVCNNTGEIGLETAHQVINKGCW